MWSVETLNAVVDSEIEALPKDLRARLVRVTKLIEAVGFEGLPHDTVKHLEGKLWEIRVKASRAFPARSMSRPADAVS
jgi:hypothetical protein